MSVNQAGPVIAEEGRRSSARPSTVVSIIAMLRRRIILFVMIVGVGTVAGIGVGLLMPLKYVASARIILDPRQQNVLNTPQVLSGLQTDPMAIDSQVEILHSTALIKKVVRQLGLDKDPEFNRPPSAGLGLRNLFGAAPEAADSTGVADDMVVDSVTERLGVASLGLSSVIQVSFKSRSPTKAARIANAFVQTYIADQSAQKAGANERATEWLSSRLDDLRANAERSDAALKHYEVDKGIVGLQSATGATATQQEIQSLTTEYAAARGEQALAEAKLQALNRAGNPADSPDGMNSPVLQALKKQRAEASAKLAQLTARYGARYPEVVTVQQGLVEIDRQMALEGSQIRAALTTEVMAARARSGQIQSQLGSANNVLKGANLAAVGANQLSNRAEADRSVYQSFLDRYKQTSAQAGIESPDARVISLASPPLRPDTPGLKLLAVLGTLVGVAAAILIVGAVEMFFGGFYNEEQIEDLGLICFGMLPELGTSLEKGEIVNGPVIDHAIQQPNSLFAEMVRGVISGGFFSSRRKAHHIIMISSTLPGEGKSSSSIVLARSLAEANIKTLLVDCDVVRRTATKLLGGDVPAGIVELVDGGKSQEDVILRDHASKLYWIGVRNDSRRTGVFNQPSLPAVLGGLRDRFDVVMIDAPPVLATADARTLVPEVDELVLAIQWSKTRRGAVRATLKVLTDLGVEPTGAILTRVDMRKQAKMGDASRYGHGTQYLAYTE